LFSPKLQICQCKEVAYLNALWVPSNNDAHFVEFVLMFLLDNRTLWAGWGEVDLKVGERRRD
jgi:hypothetical protein